MKHSYHTDIAIQYKLGILDGNVQREIPSSTLHNWKNKDFSSLFGSDCIGDYEQNLQMIKAFLAKKSLLKVAKAVYFVYTTYVTIINTIKNRNKILRQSQAIIVSTVDQVRECIGFKRALRAFGVSFQQYYSWKKNIKCKISPANLCRKIYFNQLTTKEVDTIKDYSKRPQYHNWNFSAIYFQILRDKAAFFSMTTFYKYVNRLGIQRVKPERKRYETGIRADGPKKILHMDVTIFRPLDHSRVYLYFLVDNFSRFILNWKASLRYSSEITFYNIKEAADKYCLWKLEPYIDLMCDKGSENKGAVDEYLNNHETNLRKLIARYDISFSNSMVEAVNKRMKYDFLFTTSLLNLEETQQYLTYAADQYNNKPHSALHGLTPKEVFNGILPDKYMYKPALQQASQKRKEINLRQNCLNCFDNPNPEPTGMKK